MQHRPSSVSTVSNISMQLYIRVAYRQATNISEQDCDAFTKNSRKNDHRPAPVTFKECTSAAVRLVSWSIGQISSSKDFCIEFMSKSFTIDFRAWFMLQIVTAGKGMSSIDVARAFSVIIMGDADHFEYTFDMKYRDIRNTNTNDSRKKALQNWIFYVTSGNYVMLKFPNLSKIDSFLSPM